MNKLRWHLSHCPAESSVLAIGNWQRKNILPFIETYIIQTNLKKTEQLAVDHCMDFFDNLLTTPCTAGALTAFSL
jgi:hypothetical protein